MAVRNAHERALPAPPAAVGELIDSLASSDDRLWPHARWPPMRFDRGLVVGSHGGHGPVRYTVAGYEPGRSVTFAFEPAFPMIGTHGIEAISVGTGETTVLRHTLQGRPTRWLRLGWPLCFRWLHDALIEDALDQAEAELGGTPWHPRRLPAHVRALRALLTRLR